MSLSNRPTKLDNTLRGIRRPPSEVNRSPMPLSGTKRTPTNSKRGTAPDSRLRGQGGNGGLKR